jgi:hypothetical protein
MAAAPLAADGERRLADVGQGEGAVAGHGGLFDPGLALAVTAVTYLTASAGTACNLGESYSEYSIGTVLFDVIQ